MRCSKVSEESKEITTIPFADFTSKDLEQIHKFRENGMLGIAQITHVDVERSMALYLDGKTYRQIANVLKISKEVILFLSHKFKWYEMKEQYLEELKATLPQKIIDSKLQSQEFFMHLIHAYQKKISRNVDKYLRTDDAQWADNVDVKDVNTLIKITELLHKLNNESLGNPNDKSMVSLNGLTESGVTITKTGANSVEITPKSPFASKLKQFADLKRQAEQANIVPPKPVHDIVVESKTEKESENKNE